MYFHKKIILAIFIIFFSGCVCYGQSVDTEVINKEPGYIFINKYGEYLKSSDIISLDSVLQPVSQKKFLPLPDKKIIFHGYDPYYYWFRFSINNDESSPKTFILLFGGQGVRSAELWQGNQHKWNSLGKTGYRYPFESRPYNHVHYCYSVTIAPHTSDTFYLNVDESHAYKVFVLALFHPEAMKKQENRFYFLFGIITGLLLLFATFNIFLYYTIKERIHLWYSLYILSMLFFLLKHDGLDAEFLGLDSETGYRATSMGGIALLAIGFLTHVVQSYLTNITKKSILYKFLSLIKWLAWFGAVIFLITFYIQPHNSVEVAVFELTNKLSLIAFPVILIACFYSLAKGFKPALFILSGVLVFLIGGFSRTLFIATERHIMPPSLFHIGLVVEVFIISFGLMYRYNLYKKEKEELARQLLAQKENTGRQILITQETERKRIAEDLHDELGSSLAALKLKLQKTSLSNTELKDILFTVDKASDDTRNIAHNLMPPEFEKTSLKDLLSSYYSKLNTETKIHFIFHSSDSNHNFSKEEELVIYRIIMELTNNILKHSEATDATIQLIYYEDHLELMAEDNGKGVKQQEGDGIGLKNTRSRVNYLNGNLQIDSNNGTTIMIQIPYKNK